MEVAVSEEQQANADFASGFDAPPVTAKVEKPGAEPAAKPKDDAAAAPVADVVVEAPKLAQITQEQFDNLMAAATETVSLKTQLSKAFGTMGQMKQTIDKLQSETPVGASIDLSDEDFAELAADFPELAKHTRASLEKIFKRMNVRGTGQSTEEEKTKAEKAFGPPPENIQKLLSELSVQREMESLADLHPTWRTIVGAQSDADNPFRQWLSKQPAEYQTKINSTNSATIISRAIDKFEASKTPATPAPKDTARSDRIKGAIQPKGDGGQPGPGKTADDEFREGFNSG